MIVNHNQKLITSNEWIVAIQKVINNDIHKRASKRMKCRAVLQSMGANRAELHQLMHLHRVSFGHRQCRFYQLHRWKLKKTSLASIDIKQERHQTPIHGNNRAENNLRRNKKVHDHRMVRTNSVLFNWVNRQSNNCVGIQQFVSLHLLQNRACISNL